MENHPKPVRFLALNVLTDVLQNKRSLTDALTQHRQNAKDQDQGLLQEISYGVLRHYFSLSQSLAKRLTKPLKDKDIDIHLLLLIGLYQIQHLQIRPHALVNETVSITKKIKKPWAASLVNAILRGYLRKPDDPAESTHTEHPTWWIDTIKRDWPDYWQHILHANNQRPPMTLRINTQKTTRQAYQQELDKQEINYTCSDYLPHGIILNKPVPIESLPFFKEGHISIQDSSAQLAAPFLQLEPNMRVLDVCAAPGGKTAHLIEQQPQLKKIIAVEINKKRSLKIQENIQRLEHHNIEIIVADAVNTESWWDKECFDRILLDAPCSGSGVIRRHPDIKFLRRPADIDQNTDLQKKLLHSVWALLKPGGILLYSTCSIIKQENSDIIHAFTKEVPCKEVPLDAPEGQKLSTGIQILPGNKPLNGDGFYFACLLKPT